MKKKLLKTVAALVLSLTAVLGSMMTAFAAPAKITVSEDEYDVYVSEYPSDIGSVYAKFNTKKSNVDLYDLVIWDDNEAEEILIEAFTKSGLNAENFTMLPMSLTLYEEDEEDGEMYPVTSSNPMTLICELPSEYEGVEEKLRIYVLKADGKLEPVPYTLVDVDDYICAQFSISRFTQYAFAVSNADIEAYENSLYEEDEDEDDEDTDATPTKAPTVAPTKAPTNTPTKAPSNQSGSTSQNSGNKDSVPQTGDEFSLETSGILLLLTGAALSGIIIYLKKK